MGSGRKPLLYTVVCTLPYMIATAGRDFFSKYRKMNEKLNWIKRKQLKERNVVLMLNKNVVAIHFIVTKQFIYFLYNRHC